MAMDIDTDMGMDKDMDMVCGHVQSPSSAELVNTVPSTPTGKYGTYTPQRPKPKPKPNETPC
jgi:hypothetical protein